MGTWTTEEGGLTTTTTTWKRKRPGRKKGSYVCAGRAPQELVVFRISCYLSILMYFGKRFR
jgi:hypothetical protein